MSLLARLSLLVVVVSVVALLVQDDQTGVAFANFPLTDNEGVGNATFVILNWSRLANVKLIVSDVCRNLLGHTIDSVTIWNNNPSPLSFKDFENTSCPDSRLNIVNSPENIYFEARFIACARAHTPYCFIQDDDFKVAPETIQALLYRIQDKAGSTAIHLQPAHEMLTSELRAIRGFDVHTTFAWLGYGTMVKRTQAETFLSLLDRLDLPNEDHKMADNYFSILANDLPERWFYVENELGGGQPFTVGEAGDERNNQHIRHAGVLLDWMVANNFETNGLPFPFVTSYSAMDENDVIVSRAPCIGRPCALETNISLLPQLNANGEVADASRMLDLAKQRLAHLGNDAISHYLAYPPSQAVDGRAETFFQSSQGAQCGDWLSVDYFDNVIKRGKEEWILTVDEATMNSFQSGVFESSLDGVNWFTADMPVPMRCTAQSDIGTPASGVAHRCRIRIGDFNAEKTGRMFRVRILDDMGARWTVHEIAIE